MKKITSAVIYVTLCLLIAGPESGYARLGSGRGSGGGAHSSGSHAGTGRAVGAHIGGSHVGRSQVRSYRGSGRVVVRGGSGWGWWPWFWGGALFASSYARPSVDIQDQPQIEVFSDEEQPYYWYYCQNPQGYYPYVPSCPSGWAVVDPDAAPPTSDEGKEK